MASQKDKDSEERYRTARAVGMGVLVPTMLAACVLVGCILGFLVDKWLGTAPWGLLTGLVLGSVAGVREMLKLLRNMQEDGKK